MLGNGGSVPPGRILMALLLGQVPTLETPQGGVFESNAIARYIARLADKHLFGKTAIDMVGARHALWALRSSSSEHQLQMPHVFVFRPTLSSGLTSLPLRSLRPLTLCSTHCFILATSHMTRRLVLACSQATVAALPDKLAVCITS